MNDVAARISLYHTLFQVCLILSLIFLVVSITVFFMLDIKSTIGYLTGRRARKQIKALEEASITSGRLMSKGKSMQYVDQQMKNDMGVRQAAAPGIRKVEHAVEPAAQTNVQQEADNLAAADTKGYSLMDSTANWQQLDGAGITKNTEVLMENQTYSHAGDTFTASLDERTPVMGKFLVIRELILIHTEEVI